jgi:hypothetical protein
VHAEKEKACQTLSCTEVANGFNSINATFLSCRARPNRGYISGSSGCEKCSYQRKKSRHALPRTIDSKPGFDSQWVTLMNTVVEFFSHSRRPSRRSKYLGIRVFYAPVQWSLLSTICCNGRTDRSRRSTNSQLAMRHRRRQRGVIFAVTLCNFVVPSAWEIKDISEQMPRFQLDPRRIAAISELESQIGGAGTSDLDQFLNVLLRRVCHLAGFSTGGRCDLFEILDILDNDGPLL